MTRLRLKPCQAASVAPQTQRGKRCALTAGIAGDGATIDDGLLFIRAVTDIDTPYIRLLALIASEQLAPGRESGSVFHGGWSVATMAARDPGLGDALSSCCRPSNRTAGSARRKARHPGKGRGRLTTSPSAGRTHLERLAAKHSEPRESAG